MFILDSRSLQNNQLITYWQRQLGDDAPASRCRANLNVAIRRGNFCWLAIGGEDSFARSPALIPMSGVPFMVRPGNASALLLASSTVDTAGRKTEADLRVSASPPFAVGDPIQIPHWRALTLRCIAPRKKDATVSAHRPRDCCHPQWHKSDPIGHSGFTVRKCLGLLPPPYEAAVMNKPARLESSR